MAHTLNPGIQEAEAGSEFGGLHNKSQVGLSKKRDSCLTLSLLKVV